MIYQDLNGVFYVWEKDSISYLLRFTFESIPTNISLFYYGGGDPIRYFYVDNALWYIYDADARERSSSANWNDAIKSILNGTAEVSLCSDDFFDTWKSGFKS